MPVFTIKQDHFFAECMPFTIYREGVPILAVVGDGEPLAPPTDTDRARAAAIRDALAASEPSVGPHHGAAISEQIRLATALVGTVDERGRQELRDIIAYLGRAAAKSEAIRAAVRDHDDRLNADGKPEGSTSPTGDDYNTIFAIVMDGAPEPDPLYANAGMLLAALRDVAACNAPGRNGRFYIPWGTVDAAISAAEGREG